MTRQLLLFSRHGLAEPRSLEVDTVLAGMNGMLTILLGEAIELQVEAWPQPAHVFLDPSYLERMIMNLAANARDAMAGGGVLRMAVGVVQAPGEPDCGAMPPGRYVQLTVADTGVGMDAETQKHIFEPFFTTKEVGQGTGLGLATVYGIVKQAGGYLLVNSEPGQGTRFRVLLPEHAAGAGAPVPAAAELESVARGVGTVLLAEDEEGLRAMAREALESAGYNVLAAADGEQALALAAASERPIDLLFTDVVMPRMGGRELAAKLRERQPGLPILYTSGYTERGVAGMDGVTDFAPGSAFLAKPFTPAALLRRLEEILHPAAAARQG